MPIRICGFSPRRPLDVEELDHLDHLQRRAHRAPRSGRAAAAARRRSPSARRRDLADDAAVPADRVEHQRVVGVEQLDRLLGRLRFDQRREAADVARTSPSRARACRRARNPESCRSCATSGVAKRRTSSFCWSRSRFFSRLAPMRAFSSTGLTGLVKVILGAELDAAHDVVDAFQRRRDDDRKVAQLQVGHHLLEHLRSRPSPASPCRAARGRTLRAAASPARRGRSPPRRRGGPAARGCAPAAGG